MRLRAFVCLLAVVGVSAGVLVFRRGAVAAENRPQRVVEVKDPPPAEGTGIIVAVIDTGVDAKHVGLADQCLPGINVAEPDQQATDLVGHGTGIAGLIVGLTEDGVVSGTGRGSAKLLPIKVTSGAEVETLPTLIAIGIDRAVDAGAGVICIAMGSPRSTKSLDEAMDRAREKGVLVVAAAGVSDGSADYWPAMHPWAISCTVSEQREADLPDGTKRFVAVPASKAHISGKTELMGIGFATTFTAGGGRGPLQGSSVVAARVAGYAARMRNLHAKMPAAELRRRLVLGAGPVELGNYSLNFPVRVIHENLAGTLEGKSKDLCLTNYDTNPGPVEPGKPAKIEILVTNIGDVAKEFEATVDVPGDKVRVTAKSGSLAAGEERLVVLDLPALSAGGHDGRVTVTSEEDENAANDFLPITINVMEPQWIPVLARFPRVQQLRYGENELVIAMDVQNCGDKEITGIAGGAIGETEWEQPLSLKAHETKTVTLRMVIPEMDARFTAVRPAMGFRTAEKPVHTIGLNIQCVRLASTIQYADAWATKEVILDAPAFMIEGRTHIPVLIFTPEIHTDIQTRSNTGSSRNWEEIAPRGLWLYEIHLEEVPSSEAVTRQITPGGAPEPFPGAKTLFHIECGKDTRQVVIGRTTKAHNDIWFETGVGMPMDPNDLLGYVKDNGWHAVISVPIVALKEASAKQVYLHAFVRNLDEAIRPDESRWKRFKSGTVVSEIVLRVRLHASLPKLEATGQYYDVHVHTASEFSRDAVEPRLAWGGPLWMLVRSAHAMGFVDDDFVRSVKRGDVAAVAAREVLFTTDHNCFLKDEHTPDALPYGREPEIETIRRFAGRGANQEVAMADAKSRALGASHALVYGIDPLKGPWHGGRQWLDGMLKLKNFIEELKDYGGIKVGDALFVPLCEKLRDSGVARAAILELVNAACEKKKHPKYSPEQFLAIVTAFASLKDGRFEELVNLVDRVVKAAIDRDESNDNNIEFVERQVVAHGSWIAAHPMAGGNLHWTPEDLDRAANLAAGTIPEVQTAGRFPFAGVQVWNEEVLDKAALSSPDDLRQMNFWSLNRPGTDNTENRFWHCEWMNGFLHYQNRMVLPGLAYTFDTGADRRRYFIRKLYHYAGSDAHGNFNYTTGVGATALTNPTLMPVLAMFGHGHGSTTNSSHFGCARVYAQKPAFDEVYRGRVVCTDGPLTWIELDSELKFDSKGLVWHDGWEEYSKASDVDGEIGGAGTFDGDRTALVRRDTDGAVLRYRVAEGGPRAPRVQRMDVHVACSTDQHVAMEIPEESPIPVPRPLTSWRPGDGTSFQFRGLSPWKASAAGFVFAAGFSAWDEEVDLRYDPKAKRCVTNPIWFTTVGISAQFKVLVVDGKAIIPKGEFVATFKADHSMLDASPTVLLKQLNKEGDSVAATYRLVPKRSEGTGFWQPEGRLVKGKDVEADDTVLTAINEEPIILGLPWYPRDGVNAFAIILAGAQDMHGNALNAVAALTEVEWPIDGLPLPDPGSVPDNATGPGANTGTASVQVKPGETIDLPRGATCNGQAFKPGKWAVPSEIPAAGLTLAIQSGGQAISILLLTAESRRPSQPALTRAPGGGFVGSVATPGTGPARVTVKNHTDKTLVVADPIVVTPTTCVFSAPDLAPGACTTTIEQGGKTASTEQEAVAAVLAWDSPSANVGDVRELRLKLVGASKPGDWNVSGVLTIQGGEVVSTADRVVRGPDGTITLQGLAGDASLILTARATVAGEMKAEYGVDVRKK